MNFFRFLTALVLLVYTFLLSSPAKAYTSADYYQAGLQLYNAKNYSQAVQYFSAAIQMDPHNAAALQGRANCNYVLGEYPQALDDYQKVQALQPSPQLSAMIQSLQARVGTAATAAPQAPAPSSSAAGDPFAQGVALVQQRQYAQAAPYFQQAAQNNPTDSKAFYYLGLCQMQTGDSKDAAVALGISNKLSPNPSVSTYVDRLKSGLSSDDQGWVDSQIAAAKGSENPGENQGRGRTSPKIFGIRLEPALYFVSLNDFNSALQAGQKYVQQNQATDPSLTFNGSLPTAYAGGGFEPVLKLGNDLELGLPLQLLPVGTASMQTQDNNGYFNNSSMAISGFNIGLNARFFIGKGDFQPFIAGGPLVCPINIALTGSDVSGGTTVAANGNFSSIGFGGQIQVGLDWHLGDMFVVTPMVGYQLVSASSFTGSVSASGGGISGSESGQLEFSPSSNEINFLANGQSPASGDRPLQVDLSGPYGGIQISAFF